MRDLQMALGVYDADCVLASHLRHEITRPRLQDHGGVFACASERMEHNFDLGIACWDGGLSKCAAKRVIDIYNCGATHSVEHRERCRHWTMYRADEKTGVATHRNLVRPSIHIHFDRRRDRRWRCRWRCTRVWRWCRSKCSCSCCGRCSRSRSGRCRRCGRCRRW